MAASDSIVGEGLVDSPYEELRKKYEALVEYVDTHPLFKGDWAIEREELVLTYDELMAKYQVLKEEYRKIGWSQKSDGLALELAKAETEAWKANHYELFAKYEELKFRMEGLEK